jgi:hypothetical protein
MVNFSPKLFDAGAWIPSVCDAALLGKELSQAAARFRAIAKMPE